MAFLKALIISNLTFLSFFFVFCYSLGEKKKLAVLENVDKFMPKTNQTGKFEKEKEK